jgi:hypothetical protein
VTGRTILRWLDVAAVVLMAFALRHGATATELNDAAVRAYRHKSPLEAQAAAASKVARAVLRNQARAARGGRGILR